MTTTTVHAVRLVHSDPDTNTSKQYSIYFAPALRRALTHWGRIGTKGQTQLHTDILTTTRLRHDKLAKGYQVYGEATFEADEQYFMPDATGYGDALPERTLAAHLATVLREQQERAAVPVADLAAFAEHVDQLLATADEPDQEVLDVLDEFARLRELFRTAEAGVELLIAKVKP